ncbi:MAG: metal-dependent transcriptional regulator [Acidimicrobiia bacterium]
MSSTGGQGQGQSRYLAALWCAAEAGVPLVRARLAGLLGVTSQTVSDAVAALRAAGLVEVDGRELRLTPEGTEMAATIVRRTRLVERLLIDELRLRWADAAAEVVAWERAMSAQAVEALAERLGRPTTCPHGNPIPDGGGPVDAGRRLAELEAGAEFEVLRVPELIEPPGAMLEFLQSSGVVPGARGRVTSRAGDGTVVVGLEGGSVALGADTAAHVRVA